MTGNYSYEQEYVLIQFQRSILSMPRLVNFSKINDLKRSLRFRTLFPKQISYIRTKKHPVDQKF